MSFDPAITKTPEARNSLRLARAHTEIRRQLEEVPAAFVPAE